MSWFGRALSTSRRIHGSEPDRCHGASRSVESGDEAVIIVAKETDEITAEELASKLGTINYEIVTGISQRACRACDRKQRRVKAVCAWSL